MADVSVGLRSQVRELQRRYERSCVVYAEFYQEKAMHPDFPSYTQIPAVRNVERRSTLWDTPQ